MASALHSLHATARASIQVARPRTVRAAPVAPTAPCRAWRRATVNWRCAAEGSNSATATTTSPRAPPPPPITLTEAALTHLKKLRDDKQKGEGALLLRVGVKTGGCSGMSYVMDFEDRDKVTSDDMVVPYDNGAFELVINPKSLLYLFGMRLDYSDALIGGGFQFHNPNAADSCGCGKSFGV